MENGVGVNPMLARIDNACVVGASSRQNAKFTTVCQNKGTASRGHRELVLVKLRRLLAITPRLHGLRVANSTM